VTEAVAAAPNASASGDDHRTRRRVIIGLVLIAVVVVILLLLQCGGPAATGFDYFRHKATELGNDRARVLAFVKDEVATYGYAGDARGPLATLWHGGGSPAEKLTLANRLLAHCTSPGQATIADVAPAGEAGGEAKPGRLTIVHRAFTDGDPRDTPIYDGPPGDLVGDVQSVVTTGPGTTRVTLRRQDAGPNDRVTDIDVSTAGVIGEALVFRVEVPGRPGPVETARELWHSANRVGPAAVKPGDRHDFVVWPCRISEFVRDKESELLKARGRDTAPEAESYRMLLDYAQESDEDLAQLEADGGRPARLNVPRILIVSAIPGEDDETPPAVALDLRLNDPGFAPREPNEAGIDTVAWQRTAAWSWMQASNEHEFLGNRLGVPTESAWSTFQSLQVDLPNTPMRRLNAIGAALTALIRDDVGEFSGAAFHAYRPAKAGAESLGDIEAAVRVDRDGDGWRLTGGELTVEPPTEPAPGAPRLALGADGRLDARFTSPTELATAIELALIASRTDSGEPLPERYIMRVELQRSVTHIITPGARLEFAASSPDALDTRRFTIVETDGELRFDYAVRRRSGYVVTGTRLLTDETLAGSTTHNPWYGPRSRGATPGATSLVLSRAVANRLRAGETVELDVLGELPPALQGEEVERPVARTDRLSLIERGSITVPVNGVLTDLPTLVIGVEGSDRRLVVLDDPAFPLGAVDRLSAVTTAVPLRIVDQFGVGFRASDVTARGAKLTTLVDGSVLIPPLPEDAEVAEPETVTARIILNPDAEDAAPPVMVSGQLDPTGAPGRMQSISGDRPMVPVAVIAPDAPDADPTTADSPFSPDNRAISNQVKRHALADLRAGRAVAIPTQMLRTGLGPGIAYFAHDPLTGMTIGVTEDGLHGSTSNWQQIRSRLGSELANRIADARDDLGDGLHPIHMIRGFVVAWGTYATYRLRGDTHNQAIDRLIDNMESLQESTNLFSYVPDAAMNTGPGQVAGMIGNTNADISFYIGFLGSLLVLHEELGRDEAEPAD
jgi:hypothetical protein